MAALSYLGVPEKLRELRTPYEQPPSFDASKDPQVGTPVPLPETDVLRRNIREMASKARSVTLAVYGSCEDCSERRSDPLAIPRAQGDLIIVVWMSHEQTVRNRARRYPSEFLMIADPEGQLAEQLNAYWLPRLYALDAKLRIVKCQPRGQASAQWGKGG